ncbi:stage II sporulation protein M [Caldifermentibacillus hisashii]|uniref:stage II sporulation protein M n=1 Tax=Caldifermentibacillus hisashii TaxID=996558 RepID=UPI002E215191|nr:stage II sporulation protein M [Caldifermentibacillus hisashii]
MKKVYLEQWNLFKQSYWKLFVGLLILFILSSVAVYFFMLKNEALVTTLMKQVSKMFEEKDLIDPDTSAIELAFGLFKNNTMACLLLFVSGFLPIFLPAIGIIVMNSAIMGIMFAYMTLTGQAILPMLFAGIIPHGIFEIPAIILAGTLAFYLSIGIFRKINDARFSFKSCATNSIKTFVFVCVPLLVIAAIVEAFITPIFLGMLV